MMKMLNNVKMKSLLGNQSGLAMVEFALSLPILMTLGVGFIELTQFTHAHMRVSQIALSVADNAGRINQSIDVTDVDAIMIGARIAGESIKFAENGRVILSMIEQNKQPSPNTGQKITWQRCFGALTVGSSYGAELDGATNATYVNGFGPTGRKIAAQDLSGVMFAEVVYDYQPIFTVGSSLIASLQTDKIRAIAAYPVRDRTDNVLKNGLSLDTSKQRLCTTYTAV
jgi:Flp pilus assembly protein TadG